MGNYIVTDLTRFQDPQIVCTAVIDLDTGKCLRPMPYLTSKTVEELNVLPGAILEGQMSLKDCVENPHVEDVHCSGLKYVRAASSDEFKAILERTSSASIADGFGIRFAVGQKHIPAGQTAACSIVTIRVEPDSIGICEDQFTPGKARAQIVDQSGQSFNFLSITDLGFFDYARNHIGDGQIEKAQEFISAQREVHMRVGVGRRYQFGNRDGYWLQVNGIYTFPDSLREIMAN
ncbi:MAG: hypothetical protein F4213_21205 [Boseongicola sp. SB0677_bin_26]|nr:hypothetical protein [Boseongicola sp. SB0677_bin_26]